MPATRDLIPYAEYSSPDLSKKLTVDATLTHSTNGKTTGPSDHVLGAGAVDNDKPSEAKSSRLGALRGMLTTLQDDVNEFLTQRMKDADAAHTRAEEEADLERRVLDDGVDEDDED
ncbi:unnamed protein product [Kuraishia capsulata CBS 1993]|uniref:EKC/KEOPS complex subunit GON7 n=1 Tax=Kuraishia capsulata CBS 1993 TaxID=1382522 RepID=W6MU55_9ASCO|nr:uncharacterized protein KUCA_T00001410001 [Kuraishia capsulata CBS 1993]CDK25440.1 unnamed protein product [Kuraishia capsulata CBS 1993]